MDYKDLANLIFPDAKEKYLIMKKNIQKEIYQKEQLLQDLHLVLQDLYI